MWTLEYNVRSHRFLISFPSTIISLTHQFSMPSTSLDFQKIRADSVKQCEQINALRAGLRDLLANDTVNAEKKSHRPPLPESRPILMSRMDRIQSRLSLLASSLSPSHRSIPTSRPVSAATPRRQAEHFPIATPRGNSDDPSSSADEDIIYDISKEMVSKHVQEIERTLNSKISELQAIKESIQDANIKAAAQMNERERLTLVAFVDELQRYQAPSIEASGLDELVRGHLNAIRSQNETVISEAMKDAFGLSELKKAVERVKYEISRKNDFGEDSHKEIVEKLEKKIKQASQQMSDNSLFEISKLRNDIESQIAISPTTDNSVTQKLLDENMQLRQALRRARISLAKWQADYASQRVEPVMIPEKRLTVPTVSVGENLPSLLQTLAKMWTALPPSSQECVELLGGIQSAAFSNGATSLADVVKEECSRHVEKLPIAELVARREFLLAKHVLAPQELRELDTISENVYSLISEYEAKYRQHFMYDGRDYMQSMHRANFRA